MTSKAAEGFDLAVGGSLIDPAIDWPAEEDEGGPDSEEGGHDEADGFRHLSDVASGGLQDGGEHFDHAGQLLIRNADEAILRINGEAQENRNLTGLRSLGDGLDEARSLQNSPEDRAIAMA